MPELSPETIDRLVGILESLKVTGWAAVAVFLIWKGPAIIGAWPRAIRRNGAGVITNGGAGTTAQCALARDRSDNIAKTLDALREDMSKRNTIVSDFAPRLDATHAACLALHTKMDEHLVEIRENTAVTAAGMKTLVKRMEDRAGE